MDTNNNSLKIDVVSEDSTPYTRSEAEQRVLLYDLLSSGDLLFMDKTTNPDMGEFAIYKIPGNDNGADIGKTIEANVFHADADYPPEFIQANFEPYDSNSTFLLLVDKSGESPETAGVLRIIDCKDGNSETISMFREFYGEETQLPPELTPPKDGGGLWDILTIAMKHEYRNGENSAWLYNALYKASGEEGVNNWIANVTPKEMKNLRTLIGIPFEQIPGVEPVVDVSPETGKESVYGFYFVDVSTIQDAVNENIGQLESVASGDSGDVKKSAAGMRLKLAKIARIALNGAIS